MPTRPVFVCIALLTAILGDAIAEDGDRTAIVIGNSNYENATSLANPLNDARGVGGALEDLEFRVILLEDANKRSLRRLQNGMGDLLRDAEVGLFFYAGHGLQINGENYIVPVDASLDSVGDLVNLNDFLAAMEEHTETNLIFLDACRNNPFAEVIRQRTARGLGVAGLDETRAVDVGRGLAEMKASVGTLVAYATQPGNVAEDGDTSNSPFTKALLEHMTAPGSEIREILTAVRVSVVDETRGRQIPWDHSSLLSDFYFIEPVRPRDIPIPPP